MQTGGLIDWLVHIKKIKIETRETERMGHRERGRERIRQREREKEGGRQKLGENETERSSERVRVRHR